MATKFDNLNALFLMHIVIHWEKLTTEGSSFHASTIIWKHSQICKTLVELFFGIHKWPYPKEFRHCCFAEDLLLEGLLTSISINMDEISSTSLSTESVWPSSVFNPWCLEFRPWFSNRGMFYDQTLSLHLRAHFHGCGPTQYLAKNWAV